VAAEAEPVLLNVEQAFEQLAKQLVAVDEVVEDEEEEEGAVVSPKKRKKKKGVRHIEYDPLTGEMVVKRRRKRGEEWEEFGG
jgi:hypothetical protein